MHHPGASGDAGRTVPRRAPECAGGVPPSELSHGRTLRRRRVLFVVTEGGYFVSHRLPLAKAIFRGGWEVAIATHTGSYAEVIERAGIRVVHLPWRRRRGGVGGEIRSLALVGSFCREWRPDIVFSVALKPVLLAGGVCRALGFRHQILAIAGLGHAFSGRGPLWSFVRRWVIAGLRWLAAPDSVRLLVQNPADEAFARSVLRLRPGKVMRLAGVGVDLERFAPRPLPDTVPTFVYAGRLLRSKGVLEFLESAQRLRREGVPVRCLIAGEPDEGSFDSIQLEELEPFTQDGTATWLGRRDDVPEVLGASHAVVLPTRYGEGVPKILLEAAASGRAVIASDTPGCRSVVDHRTTGLIVAPSDREALRSAMRELALDRRLVLSLGEAARAKAVAEFSADEVNRATLQLMNDLVRDEQPCLASAMSGEGLEARAPGD